MLPLNERLANVFVALGVKHSQFAREHDINRMTMYNVSIGKNRPNLDLLERICAVEPRISAEYLLRGEGDPIRNLSAPTDLNTVQQLREFQMQMNEFIEQKVKELEG